MHVIKVAKRNLRGPGRPPINIGWRRPLYFECGVGLAPDGTSHQGVRDRVAAAVNAAGGIRPDSGTLMNQSAAD